MSEEGRGGGREFKSNREKKTFQDLFKSLDLRLNLKSKFPSTPRIFGFDALATTVEKKNEARI